MKRLVMRCVLGVIAIALIMVSMNNEMTLVLPGAMLVMLFKNQLRKILDRQGRGLAFGIAGISFGLFTEVAAILANLDLPLAERALLNPYPVVDLVLAFFWYGLFVLLWYALLKKFHYSYGEMFVLAGAYGLIFEQKGAFLPMLLTPGFILPIFIMAVYALFPMLAYFLTRHRFSERSPRSFMVRYPVAIAALALHAILWKLAGMVYYPLLAALGLLV